MPISEQDRARVRPVKERVEPDLLAIPGVTGVDIDEKLTGGRPTGVAAIVVFVRSKRPVDEVPAAERIPPVVDGVPTDVQQLEISLQGGRG